MRREVGKKTPKKSWIIPHFYDVTRLILRQFVQQRKSHLQQEKGLLWRASLVLHYRQNSDRDLILVSLKQILLDNMHDYKVIRPSDN